MRYSALAASLGMGVLLACGPQPSQAVHSATELRSLATTDHNELVTGRQIEIVRELLPDGGVLSSTTTSALPAKDQDLAEARRQLFDTLNEAAYKCGAVEDEIQDAIDRRTSARATAKARGAAVTALLSTVGALVTAGLAVGYSDKSAPAGISGAVTGVAGTSGGLMNALLVGEDDSIETLRSRRTELSHQIAMLKNDPQCAMKDDVIAIKTCETDVRGLEKRCETIDTDLGGHL